MRDTSSSRAGVVAGALVLASCAPPPLVVDVPFTARDAAAIVGLERGSRLEVRGVALEVGGARRAIATLPDLERGDLLTLTVLLYASPLEALGLAAGRLPPAADRTHSRALPSGARVTLEQEVTTEGTSPWRDVRAPRGALARFRLDALEDPTCRAQEPSVFRLGGETRFAGMVPDRDGALIVGTDDLATEAHFWRVDARGATPVERPAELSDLVIFAEARTHDGLLYLFGGRRSDHAPEAWVGTLERGFSRLPDRPGARADDWIIHAAPGSLEDAPSTVYVLSERGELLRFASGKWEALASEGAMARRAFAGSGTLGGLAVASPREVWLSPGRGGGLFRWTPGAIIREPTEIDGELDALADEIRALVLGPTGPFAGTSAGIVLERSDTGWRVAARLPLVDHAVHALVPVEDGVWIAGRYGMIYEYRPGRGLCAEPTPLGANVTVLALVPSPGGLIVSALREMGDAEEELVGGAISFGDTPSVSP